MTYKLTELSEGASGAISKIGVIGVLRDGLYDLISRSGRRITINKKRPVTGEIVISFRWLNLCLAWQEAAAIQVDVPY